VCEQNGQIFQNEAHHEKSKAKKKKNTSTKQVQRRKE
jgi:hypothetical protein